jgi:type II secretory pathway predicted ATPase ExeA/putative methionine-R-sulfoxide reductase with GAF domain
MFLAHYGLRENPFGVTPDPRFLCKTASHLEAHASLIHGIESGIGFQALIAQPGMGKTTLLFNLLETYRSNARTAFLFQTQCNSREFLQYLLSELGGQALPGDLIAMHERFNQLLAREFRGGKRVIVVIDEAQNLDVSVLETVRLLSDFETARAKLMQIIIAGQLQLGEKLACGELIQLRQRISILSRLDALGEEEVKSYISHRLTVAGCRNPELFTPPAMALIASHSQGIPRNVNTLCFNALSLGCALERRLITDDITREVIADLNPDFMMSGQGGSFHVNGSGHCEANSQTQGAREDTPWHDPVLGLIVEKTRERTGATGAAIALTDGRQIICRATVGETVPELGATLDINSGFSGKCLRTGEALRCDDSFTDSRVDSEVCRRLGIRSIIAMPLHWKQTPIGILQVSSTRPNAFKERDTRTLRAAADQIVELTFELRQATTEVR